MMKFLDSIGLDSTTYRVRTMATLEQGKLDGVCIVDEAFDLHKNAKAKFDSEGNL